MVAITAMIGSPVHIKEIFVNRAVKSRWPIRRPRITIIKKAPITPKISEQEHER